MKNFEKVKCVYNFILKNRNLQILTNTRQRQKTYFPLSSLVAHKLQFKKSEGAQKSLKI